MNCIKLTQEVYRSHQRSIERQVNVLSRCVILYYDERFNAYILAYSASRVSGYNGVNREFYSNCRLFEHEFTNEQNFDRRSSNVACRCFKGLIQETLK